MLLLGVVLSGCNSYKTSGGNTSGSGTKTSSSSGNTSGSEAKTSPSLGASAVESVVIAFGDSGVVPPNISVKSGGKVTWVNSSKSKVIVASDPHPTHTDNRELSNGQEGLPLNPGESVTVTLTKTGQWGFHDHLNLSVTGKVTVE